MSKKPRNDPRVNKSAAQEFLIPGLVFGGAIVIAFVVLLFGDNFTGGDAGSERVGAQMSAELEEKFRSEYDALGVSIGPEDAELVVREFADYQCPACASFAPTAEKIREEYAETGKVRFVFFDFPLPNHQNARAAAAAARCAARQDKFWAFHERLFSAQSRWSGQNPPSDTFLDLAVESGVDVDPFRRCVEQGGADQIVSKNAEIAREVGVSSTPTTIVGRQVYAGIKNFETMSSAIESRLPKSDDSDGEQSQ